MPPEKKQLTTGPTGSRGSEGSGRDQETVMLKMRTWGGYSTGWVSTEQKAACHRRRQRVCEQPKAWGQRGWWGKGTNWRRQEEGSKPSREGPRGARVAAGSRAGGGAA